MFPTAKFPSTLLISGRVIALLLLILFLVSFEVNGHLETLFFGSGADKVVPANLVQVPDDLSGKLLFG